MTVTQVEKRNKRVNPSFPYLEWASTRHRHQTRGTTALGIGLKARKIRHRS